MNNRFTTYLKVILTLSLFVMLSVPALAQKSGVKGALDYTSNIVVNGTGDGVNNISFIFHDAVSNTDKTENAPFAGIIKGTLNGQPQKFYCIDVLHTVNPGSNPTYWDQGTTPSEITYILNNYYPFKSYPYSGSASTVAIEAASVQLAIWHFSDLADANTISNASVKTRALAIIADAAANHNNTIPLQSLIFVPTAQSLTQGTVATLNVYALDLNASPINNLHVTLTTTLGSLSSTGGNTNSAGLFGPVTLSYSSTGTATVKAQATVSIAQGTVYVDKTDPNGKQKLVLATPTTDTKEITSTVTWYTPSGPGSCDTKGFTTFTQGGWGGPSNSTPGTIRDLNFSTVFPGGLIIGGTKKLTLSTASDVKNYLPDGGTSAAYTQNYTNPTSKINILSGQLTALKLNVYYDAAGKLGSNSAKLGDLAIASGNFAGMTVSSFLAFAEAAIGGGSLNGSSYSEINDIATAINENFDNGTVDKGFLTCTEQLKASIGDRVWLDANKNGIQDNGEAGVQNVTVKLYDCSDNLKETTTTDANGLYLFSNLTPGSYYVKFILPNGYSFTVKDANSNGSDTIDSDADAATGKTTCTALSAGENDLTWDAGIFVTPIEPANLGNKVWDDTNKNGVQDSGENGIANVVVNLYSCDNTFVATTATDASGVYHFANLTPGDYYVKFVLPSGYTFSPVDQGGNDATDSDANTSTGKTVCTTLTAGETDNTWDAGLIKDECLNTIGSYVYRDLNVNGTKDTGEAGIAGAKVELVQGSTVIATATTDVNGQYSFPNLVNGTYTVRLASSNFAAGGVFLNTAQTKWYTKNSTSVNTSLSCGDNLSINFGYYKTCVSITKTTSKQSYNNGETITYSFLVENCGDVQLHGGIDIFDAMLNTTGNHLIKHIDILDAHQSTTFTANYLTSDKDCGQLVNTVRAEGHPVDGSATVIDESTWTVNIVCQDKADLKIEKTVDNTNPQCDDYVTFTIKTTNLGPNTANSVVVNDQLPTGLNYVSNTASQGSYNSAAGIWTVGTLTNGSFATLTITVKVDCGQLNNSAFDLGVAKDYNLFVLEDANQPSSDTQGKVAVGGNATFANYSVGDQLSNGSGDVLVVGNDLNYYSGAIYNGNVVYGHATNLPLSNVSITGGTLRKDNPINFAAAKVYLENLSTTLSNSAVNGTTAFQYGEIKLTGSDPFLNVFDVTGANLSSANNFTINVPNGSVVLVNIGGTTLTWMGGLVVNGTAISNVLFNFYEATSLTIQGIDIRGSLLAPFADVTFASGMINGQMICKSLTGMGQFNAALFGGQIPMNKNITNIASISGSSVEDPNTGNNSSSAMVTITGTAPTGGGNTGSGNTGGTWTNVCSFGQGEIVYTLAYSGSDIYAGTWGGKIYKSTDAGKNWVRINMNMNVSFIWSLNISGGIIFAATEQGVYKYNGSDWVLTSLSGKDVHSIASHNGSIYAGTWGFGVFKSIDGGSTWSEINNGLGGFLAVQSLTITGNGNVFAGTAGGGIFECTDGLNWKKITCGYSVIWSMASTSNAIFSGTYGDGLYRSLDGGMSFTKTSLDISFVYSISVDLSGKIYVSSLTNGVYLSEDNGSTWTSLGMSGYGVSAMIVNPNSSDVFVGTKEGKVFKISSTEGTTGVEDNGIIPNEFSMAQNYPNPFNPSTTIQFVVPETGRYSLKVYNIIGEEVATLINEQLASGLHKVNFDASRLASGMYIYRLSGSNVNISKKMILMK